MFAQHPAARALVKMGAFEAPKTRAMLDEIEQKKNALLDATGEAMASFAAADIRSAAAAAVKEWAGTAASDLDDGESMADRLLALAIGIANENQDGEITDDEAEVASLALNAMADYMATKGVDDADIEALLENTDAEAGDRVAEFLSGGDQDDEDVDKFAFDAESSASVLDSILDAVYKKKTVIRGGKKMRINKRVSGHVRLSAGQKLSIRKAGLKSRSSTAKMHRLKSMKIRARSIGK